MDKYGELVDDSTIRLEWLLSASIDEVWSYLVNGEKKGRWFCGGDVEERVGGRVDMHFHNSALSEQPDDDPPPKYADLPEIMEFTGTVTECDPPRRLAYTWDADDDQSEVLYELAEQDGGTLLTITHSKLSSPDEVLGCSGGWHTHLIILDCVLASEPAPPFWRTHTPIEAEYAERFGF